MKAIIVAQLIWQMNVSADVKQLISKCVFYNIRKDQNVNLFKRFQSCKATYFKKGRVRP